MRCSIALASTMLHRTRQHDVASLAHEQKARILIVMNPVRDKNLESSGSPQASVSNGMKRVGVAVILILAFSGLANSAYLAKQEASGEPIICDIQNLSGCNIVTSSEYSKLFGIPLAQYGVLFYGILFVLAALELVIFDRLLRRFLQVISFIGVIFSLYFTFVQVFFIGAFCIYCLTSAVIAFLILVFASFIEPMKIKERREISTTSPSPSVPAKNLRMPPIH